MIYFSRKWYFIKGGWKLFDWLCADKQKFANTSTLLCCWRFHLVLISDFWSSFGQCRSFSRVHLMKFSEHRHWTLMHVIISFRIVLLQLCKIFMFFFFALFWLICAAHGEECRSDPRVKESTVVLRSWCYELSPYNRKKSLQAFIAAG